eukprot:scaffold7349_cov173-Amphora_coffeaeformis.AAC.61
MRNAGPMLNSHQEKNLQGRAEYVKARWDGQCEEVRCSQAPPCYQVDAGISRVVVWWSLSSSGTSGARKNDERTNDGGSSRQEFVCFLAFSTVSDDIRYCNLRRALSRGGGSDG